MTDLVVRKIRGEFDASVPFAWQPRNPSFGLFCNAFTSIAVPFERYIVSVVRMAQERWNKLNTGPAVGAEADAFLRQEPQHSAAHRKHWLSQTPSHDPADQPLPDWADTWMREYERGTDMTKFFGSFGPTETAER